MSLSQWQKCFPRAQVALFPVKTKHCLPGIVSAVKAAGHIMHNATVSTAQSNMPQRSSTSQHSNGCCRLLSPAVVSKRAIAISDTALRLVAEKNAQETALREQQRAFDVKTAADAEKVAMSKMYDVPVAHDALQIVAPFTLGQLALQITGAPAAGVNVAAALEQSSLNLLHTNFNLVLSELWMRETKTSVVRYGQSGGGPDKCRVCIEFFWTELVVLCTGKYMPLVLMAGKHPSLVHQWVQTWATSHLAELPRQLAPAATSSASSEANERSVTILWQLALRAYIVFHGGPCRIVTGEVASGCKRPRADPWLDLSKWLQRSREISRALSEWTSPGTRQNWLLTMLLQVVKPFQRLNASEEWAAFVDEFVIGEDSESQDVNSAHVTRHVTNRPQDLVRKLAAATTAHSTCLKNNQSSRFLVANRWPGGTVDRPIKQMRQAGPLHSTKSAENLSRSRPPLLPASECSRHGLTFHERVCRGLELEQSHHLPVRGTVVSLPPNRGAGLTFGVPPQARHGGSRTTVLTRQLPDDDDSLGADDDGFSANTLAASFSPPSPPPHPPQRNVPQAREILLGQVQETIMGTSSDDHTPIESVNRRILL